ncbi:putative quinol monooxygenase [Acuticoccus sp. MNP-M23]|uniref:putative quinol monooxygenase n=1 Tax=Acuticoccus sp. MNP-M23 TaxID=3072793 RepID=UPI00281697BC|nr:putative quinol monooxygenase [Acuticoccus sp. MNP-M23]WMS40936.1 putative quinol monooxygenase [Acuticoccus sp. MNP-M23]
MTEPLFLFAQIRPKPVHFDAAREAIRRIVPETENEPGCQGFALHENAQDGCLYLYEEWRDEDALKAHYAQPYTKAVFAKYENWLAEPVVITKMRRLA